MFREQKNGILLLEKPAGMTSASLVSLVKKSAGFHKVGHAGTLDPFATGLMVICINQATRLARFFLHGDKAYRAKMRLGIKTDTDDCTGKTIATCNSLSIDEAAIRRVFSRFTGEFDQVPPRFSALKKNGIPLYRLARRGETVQKPARRVTVYSLRLLDLRIPDVEFELSCGSGTYVRALARDIGDELGCGAHLTRLHRVSCGGFTIGEAMSLDRFLDTVKKAGDVDLIGMDESLRLLPKIVAQKPVVEKIRFGKRLYLSDVAACKNGSGLLLDKPVRIADSSGRLLAVILFNKKGGKFDYLCSFPFNIHIEEARRKWF